MYEIWGLDTDTGKTRCYRRGIPDWETADFALAALEANHAGMQFFIWVPMKPDNLQQQSNAIAQHGREQRNAR